MAKSNVTPVATASPNVRYQLSKLRENTEKIFGVSACTFAGATANLPDGEYTIDEIKSAIKTWQKKEVR